MHAEYDIIIVGAGISGLYVARELLKRYPGLSIALAERYKGLGGRTYSYFPPGFEGIHWEMGAGRIHKNHTLLMKLIKEYNLTWIPIGEDISYKQSPDSPIIKNEFVPVYIKPLEKLSETILGSHTIQELMVALYGKSKTREILSYFPYRAEVTTLRADLALKEFLKGGEMSSHKGYGVLAEGFSELVERLRADIESRGCTILQKHRLLNLERADGGATDLEFEFGYKEDPNTSGKITLRAKRSVVLALHKDAISEIPAFHDWKILEHLKCEPLLRTYAIFPTRGGKSWFTGMSRIVTPERPRYILPMNSSNGTIMISYTDADDTKDYITLQEKKGDKALEKQILEDVRNLFPKLEIPNPLFFRSHPWITGATYWLPGNYSPLRESQKSVHPLPSKLPKVWLCGESWSLKQAWVEGALEQAELCLKKIKV